MVQQEQQAEVVVVVAEREKQPVQMRQMHGERQADDWVPSLAEAELVPWVSGQGVQPSGQEA